MAVKTPRELNAHIMQQLESVLDKEVAFAVKEEQSEQVHQEVYAKYSPRKYERRENDGGLSDVRNMVHSTERMDAYNLELVVSNMTTGKGMDGIAQPNRYIAWGVEVGHERGGTYDVPASPYANPRPFLEATVENLKDSSTLRNMIIKGLRMRGFQAI